MDELVAKLREQATEQYYAIYGGYDETMLKAADKIDRLTDSNGFLERQLEIEMAEVRRLRAGLQKIKRRYIEAVGKGEEASGALVVELANYAAEALPGLPPDSASPEHGK
jgi:predicted RNase H-like nuclease (RuvC/YqgF family)